MLKKSGHEALRVAASGCLWTVQKLRDANLMQKAVNKAGITLYDSIEIMYTTRYLLLRNVFTHAMREPLHASVRLFKHNKKLVLVICKSASVSLKCYISRL